MRKKKEKENQKTKRIFIFHDRRNRVETISFFFYYDTTAVVCLGFRRSGIEMKNFVFTVAHGRCEKLIQKRENMHTEEAVIYYRR